LPFGVGINIIIRVPKQLFDYEKIVELVKERGE